MKSTSHCREALSSISWSTSLYIGLTLVPLLILLTRSTTHRSRLKSRIGLIVQVYRALSIPLSMPRMSVRHVLSKVDTWILGDESEVAHRTRGLIFLRHHKSLDGAPRMCLLMPPTGIPSRLQASYDGSCTYLQTVADSRMCITSCCIGGRAG